MTIHEIKRRTAETAPHHFKRATMKFFGQTLHDYRVEKQPGKKESTPMICMECGNLFTRIIGEHTYEVKCPKCGGYDTDVR